MAKVILQGHIKVPLSERDQIVAALDAHIAQTRQEPGCLIFEVTPHGNCPERFDVYEEFVDQQAFDAHQIRVQSSEWGRVSRNVKRCYQLTICGDG